MNDFPSSFDELFEQLDLVLDKEANLALKEAFFNLSEIEFKNRTHLDFVFFIRNRFFYSMPTDNSFKTSLNNDYNIFDGDDFSSVVISAYYRHKHKIPYDLKEIVRKETTMGWMI